MKNKRKKVLSDICQLAKFQWFNVLNSLPAINFINIHLQVKLKTRNKKNAELINLVTFVSDM